MAKQPIDKDKVVREVLTRLGLAPDAKPAAAGEPDISDSSAALPSARQQAPTPATSSPETGELTVSCPVVTMVQVGEKLEKIRRLVVPPQAVVTPSVRDELRRRNIALVYGCPATAPFAASARLVIMVLGARFDPVPLTSALKHAPVEVQTRKSDCVVGATDELADELSKPGTLGLLVSTYPAVALCLANRHRGVRAVWGVDAGRLAADAASVGANLLVLDPRITSLFQLKQMTIQFCRQRAAECPENLRERLG